MVVSNRYDPDPRVAKEASALAGAGLSTRVLAFDRHHERPPGEHDAGGFVVERLRAPRPLPRNMAATRAGLEYFARAARRRLLALRPQVVHCHDQDTCGVGLWWQKAGARRAGLPRGRFVFDAHDLYWTWALLPDPDARWRKLLAAVLRANDRRFARAADLLVTVTEGARGFEGTAEVYRSWGCAPLVVWNAPEPPDAVPPLPARFTVGYVGNVREPGMFRDLLEAIERLPAAERPGLRIAGDGRSAAEVGEMVERAAQRLDVPARVTGAFTSAELSSLMAECSVQYCVYPTARGNIDRAMPVKLLESVAYGRRVIGNADTLMGDWIEGRDWGWTVHDGDTAALARALAEARSAITDRQPPALAPPPLWPEQGARLVHAYERLVSG